jgi:ABC-type transport system involved in cytochrome c biogenesis permease subunit
VLGFHQLAAAIYLAAGMVAVLGVVLPAPRMLIGATWGLLLGVVVHGVAFATLHLLDPPPPLTNLPSAVSLVAGISVIFLLVLMWRLRVASLTAVAGPVAFLSVFYGALRLPHAGESSFGSGSWPHAHILLSSAGLALLGVAGLAGLFFLIEHRRLKAKHPMGRESMLPSLEALDRVNVVALAVGFPLLTLGLVTGMFWVHEALGRVWTGADHESWSAIACAIYAGLVLARFVGHQGARQAAASALAGFAFLLFAILGVGLLA